MNYLVLIDKLVNINYFELTPHVIIKVNNVLVEQLLDQVRRIRILTQVQTCVYDGATMYLDIKVRLLSNFSK
jgi:hypothetical protein